MKAIVVDYRVIKSLETYNLGWIVKKQYWNRFMSRFPAKQEQLHPIVLNFKPNIRKTKVNKRQRKKKIEKFEK